MNYKKFKKIIKNLFKIVLIAIVCILSPILNVGIRIEYWLHNTIDKLNKRKPSKAPFYRNSSHEFIKDVGYIHREEI